MKIHIDIDCFFVSATRLLHPELEGKPVAIGGRSDTKIFSLATTKQTVNFEKKSDDLDAFKDDKGNIRGILTTSSYEARAFGVKTAMNISEALRLCPKLIIKTPDMALYQKLSHQLHEFLQMRIPLVEQASIDEFYGDLGGWVEDNAIEEFIQNLKNEIQEVVKLPVSIGVAKTRYIAKLATSCAKPYGCKIIKPHEVDTFIQNIPVGEFAGVGKSMQQKLTQSAIYTLGDLKSRQGTVESWGPYAKELYARISGISDTPIQTKQRRKSIGISRTFDKIFCRDELKRRVHILARHLSYAILKLDVIPTIFHLGISYEMNQKSHKNISLSELFTEKKFNNLCIKLFEESDIHKRLHIIRISINCSSFTRDSKKELSLIGFADDGKMKELTTHSQLLRERYGVDILKWGSELC